MVVVVQLLAPTTVWGILSTCLGQHLTTQRLNYVYDNHFELSAYGLVLDSWRNSGSCVCSTMANFKLRSLSSTWLTTIILCYLVYGSALHLWKTDLSCVPLWVNGRSAAASTYSGIQHSSSTAALATTATHTNWLWLASFIYYLLLLELILRNVFVVQPPMQQ